MWKFTSVQKLIETEKSETETKTENRQTKLKL